MFAWGEQRFKGSDLGFRVFSVEGSGIMFSCVLAECSASNLRPVMKVIGARTLELPANFVVSQISAASAGQGVFTIFMRAQTESIAITGTHGS